MNKSAAYRHHLITLCIACGLLFAGCAEPSDEPTMTVYEATLNNNLEQVQANIAHGADLNALTADGDYGRYSALHAASRAGYVDIVRALIDAGADVNIEADAPHRAAPLHWAARAGHLEAVVLLVEAGAEVNKASGLDDSLTPMRVALDGGHDDVVEYLASNGGRL